MLLLKFVLIFCVLCCFVEINASPFGFFGGFSASNSQTEAEQAVQNNQTYEFLKAILTTPLYGPGLLYKVGKISQLLNRFAPVMTTTNEHGQQQISKNFNGGIVNSQFTKTLNSPNSSSSSRLRATTTATEKSSSTTSSSVDFNFDADDQMNNSKNSEDTETKIEEIFGSDSEDDSNGKVNVPLVHSRDDISDDEDSDDKKIDTVFKAESLVTEEPEIVHNDDNDNDVRGENDNETDSNDQQLSSEKVKLAKGFGESSNDVRTNRGYLYRKRLNFLETPENINSLVL